jgi:hypothetical protein
MIFDDSVAVCPGHKADKDAVILKDPSAGRIAVHCGQFTVATIGVDIEEFLQGSSILA